MTDKVARYLEATADLYAKGYVKIHVTDHRSGVAGETLWARPWETPDTFMVDNIPFFTDLFTFEDVVRCRPDKGALEFVEVVLRGPWQAFHFLLSDEYGVGRTIDSLGIKSDLTRVERGHGTFFAGVTQESDRVLPLLRELINEGHMLGYSHPLESALSEDLDE